MEVIDSLGQVSVPLPLILLGGNLARGPQRIPELRKSVIVLNVLMKLVINAGFGFGMTLLAMRLGLLLPDPLFAMVLIIQV